MTAIAASSLSRTVMSMPLAALAAEAAPGYASAAPFPHAAFDNFLPAATIAELQETFPGPESPAWGVFETQREKKLALRSEEHLPEAHLRLLREFNGQAFLAFLRTLSGIEGLVPDPDYQGGGLHQIQRGGVLKVHADFNLHPVTGLQRRINVILYLNDDWDDSFGGHLELWDKAMTSAVQRIAPLANRLVVFSTTSTSFHGHPEPLACPPERTRQSMAWYYYARPRRNVVEHVTLFQPRPGESLYSAREATRIKLERAARAVKAVTPPAVVEASRRVRGRKS